MNKYKLDILETGSLAVNAYLIFNSEDKILYIIDPGEGDIEIIDTAKKYNYKKSCILLTHAHVDHTKNIGKVFTELNVEKVYLHKNELELYYSDKNVIPPYISKAENLPDTIDELEQKDFVIINTPGHTPGGVSFYFKEMNAVFTGDTLFFETVGRTDLPGSNYEDLKKYIQQNLFCLDDKIIAYPGHGWETSIGHEKKNNPYVKL